MLGAMKRGAAVAALVMCGALAGASAAQAGTYTVYACSTPDGKPAPMEGWVGTSSPGAPNWTGHAAYCTGSDPKFVLQHDVSTSPQTWPFGALAAYTFTAPQGTRVTSAVVRRRYSGSDTQTMAYQARWRDQYGEWCPLAWGCASLDGDATYGGIDSTSYVLQQVCGGPGDCTGSRVVTTEVRRAATTLEDPASPSFASPPSGPLVEPRRTLAGVVAASLPLSDAGGGLADVRLEVDGAVVGSWGVDANAGRCVKPYRHVVPCKLAATAAIEWDSNRVADGVHSARLLVDDAAGNTLVYGPFQIDVRNTPNRCGPGTAGVHVGARFRGAGARVTVRRGRALRVRGRLTSGGAPVANATVQLVARVRRRGAKPKPTGRVAVTGADGRFRLRVPAGPSRTLRLAVRAGAADTRFTCSRPLRLGVRAAATLRASRRHLSGPSSVRFSGRLRGGHIPARGKIVVLQGREDGRWRSFAVTRSDRRGRFDHRYRFRGVPGTYPVRALIPADASYPFARGASRSVVIRIS
jgi:hypothetical protein